MLPASECLARACACEFCRGKSSEGNLDVARVLKIVSLNHDICVSSVPGVWGFLIIISEMFSASCRMCRKLNSQEFYHGHGMA